MCSVPESGKRCSSCNEWKPYEQFHRGNGYRDGYTGQCKRCRWLVQKAYRSKSPEVHRESVKRWYIRHGNAYFKKWQQQNRTIVRKASNDWKKRNSERSTHYVNQYRARRLSAPGSHTQEEWTALCQRVKYRCVACGLQTALTRDHIVPLAVGGSDYINNIQPLCKPCNSRKGVASTDFRAG